LSDGLHSGNPEALGRIVAALAQAEVQRFTIALGADADATLLEGLASSPEHFHRSPTPEDLEGIYLEIAEDLGCR
jgi:hypothetical protein